MSTILLSPFSSLMIPPLQKEKRDPDTYRCAEQPKEKIFHNSRSSRCHPRHLTTVQNYKVHRYKPSSSPIAHSFQKGRGMLAQCRPRRLIVF
ncbi:hypothetical protein TNCV_563971 [Trichonephila clavipes]|nr:hypothetical protein TNCV_563971 [Trichonephila clavipes]